MQSTPVAEAAQPEAAAPAPASNASYIWNAAPYTSGGGGSRRLLQQGGRANAAGGSKAPVSISAQPMASSSWVSSWFSLAALPYVSCRCSGLPHTHACM